MPNDLISREALLSKVKTAAIPEGSDYVTEHDVLFAPAVDAAEVVRCKDCIHFERLPDTDDLDDFGKCLEERGEATMAGLMVLWPDEMYCSYGERRADDGQDN